MHVAARPPKKGISRVSRVPPRQDGYYIVITAVLNTYIVIMQHKPVFLRRVLYCDFPHSHHCALVPILFEHVHGHYSDGWTESEQPAPR